MKTTFNLKIKKQLPLKHLRILHCKLHL